MLTILLVRDSCLESLCFLALTMVIKSTLVHSGWSYGKGDDQYDNESIGSTRTAFNLEKFDGKFE
jgi:hypothetical protein